MEKNNNKIVDLIEEIEEKVCPKDKLVCMLHSDGWINRAIYNYFLGSDWDLENVDEVDDILMCVKQIIHKYIAE